MRALSCLGCLLLLASANAVAGPVYKWKDAHGVTQYSETPPAGKKFETREQAGLRSGASGRVHQQVDVEPDAVRLLGEFERAGDVAERANGIPFGKNQSRQRDEAAPGGHVG